MEIGKKILTNIQELADYRKAVLKKKVVLCQGHFNVIHPGHIRFLEFAKKQGDKLVIAVQGYDKLEPKVRDKFYNVQDRARGVASLNFVDRVFIFESISFQELAETLKPIAYVLGSEFLQKKDEIKNQIDIIENLGGKVIFSSGDIKYASTEFLEKDVFTIKEERHEQFKEILKKRKITKENLLKIINNYSKCHLLVIGDTIVDQYVVCDPVGMSSEAPVIVIKEIQSKEYVGGAAIVAQHVKKLGATCSFISVVGNDIPGRFIKKQLIKNRIKEGLFIDPYRPTTFKIRYIVGTQKVLRVSRLKDHFIDKKYEDDIISLIDQWINSINGIIVCDFGYGIITPNIIDYLSDIKQKKGVKLFGDSQSSSQIGDFLKFQGFDFISPTEKEARIALHDKYSGLETLGKHLLDNGNISNVIITLGENGFISYKKLIGNNLHESQHFPALNPNPVDVVGAGDALLTSCALSLCAGADLMEASAIAAIHASIAVSKIGNLPITNKEILELLEEL